METQKTTFSKKHKTFFFIDLKKQNDLCLCFGSAASSGKHENILNEAEKSEQHPSL
jgi:hypothetical protein